MLSLNMLEFVLKFNITFLDSFVAVATIGQPKKPKEVFFHKNEKQSEISNFLELINKSNSLDFLQTICFERLENKSYKIDYVNDFGSKFFFINEGHKNLIYDAQLKRMKELIDQEVKKTINFLEECKKKAEEGFILVPKLIKKEDKFGEKTIIETNCFGTFEFSVLTHNLFNFFIINACFLSNALVLSKTSSTSNEKEKLEEEWKKNSNKLILNLKEINQIIELHSSLQKMKDFIKMNLSATQDVSKKLQHGIETQKHISVIKLLPLEAFDTVTYEKLENVWEIKYKDSLGEVKCFSLFETEDSKELIEMIKEKKENLERQRKATEVEETKNDTTFIETFNLEKTFSDLMKNCNKEYLTKQKESELERYIYSLPYDVFKDGKIKFHSREVSSNKSTFNFLCHEKQSNKGMLLLCTTNESLYDKFYGMILDRKQELEDIENCFKEIDQMTINELRFITTDNVDNFDNSLNNTTGKEYALVKFPKKKEDKAASFCLFEKKFDAKKLNEFLKKVEDRKQKLEQDLHYKELQNHLIKMISKMSNNVLEEILEEMKRVIDSKYFIDEDGNKIDLDEEDIKFAKELQKKIQEQIKDRLRRSYFGIKPVNGSITKESIKPVNGSITKESIKKENKLDHNRLIQQKKVSFDPNNLKKEENLNIKKERTD